MGTWRTRNTTYDEAKALRAEGETYNPQHHRQHGYRRIPKRLCLCPDLVQDTPAAHKDPGLLAVLVARCAAVEDDARNDGLSDEDKAEMAEVRVETFRSHRKYRRVLLWRDDAFLAYTRAASRQHVEYHHQRSLKGDQWSQMMLARWTQWGATQQEARAERDQFQELMQYLNGGQHGPHAISPGAHVRDADEDGESLRDAGAESGWDPLDAGAGLPATGCAAHAGGGEDGAAAA